MSSTTGRGGDGGDHGNKGGGKGGKGRGKGDHGGSPSSRGRGGGGCGGGASRGRGRGNDENGRGRVRDRAGPRGRGRKKASDATTSSKVGGALPVSNEAVDQDKLTDEAEIITHGPPWGIHIDGLDPKMKMNRARFWAHFAGYAGQPKYRNYVEGGQWARAWYPTEKGRDKAIEYLDGKQIGNRCIRVVKKEVKVTPPSQDMSKRKGKGKVLEASRKTNFLPGFAGTIVGDLDFEGNRPWVKVRYETQKEADHAVKILNRRKLKTRKVRVREHNKQLPDSELPPSPDDDKHAHIRPCAVARFKPNDVPPNFEDYEFVRLAGVIVDDIPETPRIFLDHVSKPEDSDIGKEVASFFEPFGNLIEYYPVPELNQYRGVVLFPTPDDVIETYLEVVNKVPRPMIRGKIFETLPLIDCKAYAKTIPILEPSPLLTKENYDAQDDAVAYKEAVARFKPWKKSNAEGHKFIGFRSLLTNRLPRNLTDTDVNQLATLFNPSGKLVQMWYDGQTQRPKARFLFRTVDDAIFASLVARQGNLEIRGLPVDVEHDPDSKCFAYSAAMAFASIAPRGMEKDRVPPASFVYVRGYRGVQIINLGADVSENDIVKHFDAIWNFVEILDYVQGSGSAIMRLRDVFSASRASSRTSKEFDYTILKGQRIRVSRRTISNFYVVADHMGHNQSVYDGPLMVGKRCAVVLSYIHPETTQAMLQAIVSEFLGKMQHGGFKLDPEGVPGSQIATVPFDSPSNAKAASAKLKRDGLEGWQVVVDDLF